MSGKLYKATLSDYCRDGVFFVDVGTADAVEVDGVLYASMYDGAYMTRAGDNWHRTRSAAMLVAADEIEKRLASMAAQVAKLREDAMEPVTA